MSDLFKHIADLIPTLGGWTTIPKAQTFASVIIGLRPDVSAEIGCWCGRGVLSMALAHKEIGKGVVYAIDPWSPAASVEGQVNEADRNHWANADHESVYQEYEKNVKRLGVSDCVRTIRAKSRDVEPMDNIGFLVIDGNHGPASIEDVARFAPKVKMGGLVYMDDINWAGAYVSKALQDIKKLGFTELYPIETGIMLQRV